jgi:hypothetical protein
MDNISEASLAGSTSCLQGPARGRNAFARLVSRLDSLGVVVFAFTQQVVRSRALEQEEREQAREAEGDRQCLELSRGQFNARYSEQLNIPASSAEELLPASAMARRAALWVAPRHLTRASSLALFLGILSLLEGMCSRAVGDAMLVCRGEIRCL